MCGAARGRGSHRSNHQATQNRRHFFDEQHAVNRHFSGSLPDRNAGKSALFRLKQKTQKFLRQDMRTQEKESRVKRATQALKTIGRHLKEKIKKVEWLNSFTVILVIIFFAVMFFDSALELVGKLLGTENYDAESDHAHERYGKKEVLTFIGLGVGGLVLWQRARSAEKQAEATKNAAESQAKAAESQAKAAESQARAAESQAEANKLTEAGHAQERLKTSIEHLGSDKASVRIGGAYELYHLAKDNKSYRETVCDILCSHIRQKTQEENYKADQKDGPSEEIKTHLNLLCGKGEECPFSECQIDLSSSFLRGVNWRGAKLRRANLSGAQLQRARLSRAQLQGASLSGAQLQGASLSGAQLQGARLSRAQLQGASLSGAQLQGASLSGVQLQGARLSRAQLQGASLSGAQLQGASLWGAQLQGARLSRAQLQGASLSRAQLQGANLQEAQLQMADLSGAQLHGVNSSTFPQRSFQSRIRAGIGKESDFSNAVFSGGLDADQVKEIISSMPDRVEDKERKKMEDRLNEHVDKKAGNELPDNSGAIAGAYTKDEAEKWVAEYEKATGCQSMTDESRSAATRRN